jgi:hypothetical protein
MTVAAIETFEYALAEEIVGQMSDTDRRDYTRKELTVGVGIMCNESTAGNDVVYDLALVLDILDNMTAEAGSE